MSKHEAVDHLHVATCHARSRKASLARQERALLRRKGRNLLSQRHTLLKTCYEVADAEASAGLSKGSKKNDRRKTRRSYAAHNVPVVSSGSWTEPWRSKRPRNAVSGGSATAVSAAAGPGKKAAAVGAAPRWSIPQGIRSAVAGDSVADTDIERVRDDVMSTLTLILVGELCKSEQTLGRAFTLPARTAWCSPNLRYNNVFVVRWQPNMCCSFRRRSRQNCLHWTVSTVTSRNSPSDQN
jgi:hypothetical protein